MGLKFREKPGTARQPRVAIAPFDTVQAGSRAHHSRNRVQIHSVYTVARSGVTNQLHAFRRSQFVYEALRQSSTEISDGPNSARSLWRSSSPHCIELANAIYVDGSIGPDCGRIVLNAASIAGSRRVHLERPRFETAGLNRVKIRVGGSDVNYSIGSYRRRRGFIRIHGEFPLQPSAGRYRIQVFIVGMKIDGPVCANRRRGNHRGAYRKRP